jgi:hypothetical protein
MKRSTLNFVIDLVSFVDLVGLVFTGFIIRYILPAGSGGRGRALHDGQGAEHIKTLCGMTRHEWGDIHFYFAVAFIILLTVHMILHWAWIKNYVKSLLGLRRKLPDSQT